MRIILWLTLSCCFFIFSCEKTIPFPAVDSSPLLVTNAFITPDSIWQIKLSKSNSIDSDLSFEPVKNGTVSVKNLTTNQTIQLTHRANGNYVAETPLPEMNTTYQLIAMAPNFTNITATSIIPTSFTAKHLSNQKSIYQKEKNYLFDLAIEDNASETNYYLFEVQYLLENQQSTVFTETKLFSFDPNSENETIVVNHSNLKRSYLTDENFNGQNYTTQIGASASILENVKPEDHLKAIISIKSISQDGYLYFKSLERFENLDNEIFAEPLSVYSKIENGLGIFTGYTEQRLEIVLQ